MNKPTGDRSMNEPISDRAEYRCRILPTALPRFIACSLTDSYAYRLVNDEGSEPQFRSHRNDPRHWCRESLPSVSLAEPIEGHLGLSSGTRLDATISFHNLSPEVVHRVVDKFVVQLEGQLAERSVTIELTDDSRDWVANKGYDRLYGARPLARVIQEHIKKPLADELLFGELVDGGHVKVLVKDRKLAFDIDTSAVEKKPDSGDKDGEGDGDRKISEPVDS